MDHSQLTRSPVNDNNNSPFSPIIYKQSRNQETVNQYLPGYLLGSSPNVGSPGRSFSSASSLHRSNDSVLKWRSRPSQSSQQTYPLEQRNTKTSPQRRSPYSVMHPNMKNKTGAPPTESLFSPTKSIEYNMETDVMNNTAQSPFTSATPLQLGRKESLSNKSLLDYRDNHVPHSPAQIDPFFSQGDNITSDDILDDTAVTIFGFPPAMSSYILQQFAQYGTIDKYEIHNTGNWLHIKFDTKIQAKKALSKNGKVISQFIMIGVLPCIKKDIAAKEAQEASKISPNNVCNISDHRKHPSIRSLTAPPTNAISSIEDISLNTQSNENRTPNRKGSVVSKVVDYVFGW